MVGKVGKTGKIGGEGGIRGGACKDLQIFIVHEPRTQEHIGGCTLYISKG